jgi:7,8-dihydro-6-hydroxymethylpterin-pyrophosphokinase
MSFEPRGLVHLEAKGYEGLSQLQEKIRALQSAAQIVAISSAYKRRKASDAREELLEIVLMLEGLGSAENYFQAAQKAGGSLLMVEGELRLDPQLTLPNPDLQLDPFVLSLAAECAPHWEHRVKKKSLLALSREAKVRDDVEFLTQGHALINFEKKGLK